MSWQDPMFVVKKECDLSSQFFVSRDTERVGKVITRRLATLESGSVTEKAIAHPTLPRAWSEAGTEGEKGS